MTNRYAAALPPDPPCTELKQEGTWIQNTSKHEDADVQVLSIAAIALVALGSSPVAAVSSAQPATEYAAHRARARLLRQRLQGDFRIPGHRLS